RDRATRREDEAAGPTTVTGLLRMTEPKGALLRRNDPGQERWYSRDVQAIALARGLGSVAPYFVDADAAPMPVGERAPNARRWPAGGLTVVSFNNNHLSYAITWYVLALMVAFAAWHAQREGRRRRDAASALAEDGKGEGSGHGAGR
ncbi:MAG TPA: SURF1 family cytochrome oxidase biogenesis protein, partial [Variovorax sp.]